MFEACKELAKTNKKVLPFLEVYKDLQKNMNPYISTYYFIEYIANTYIDLESMTKDPKELKTKKENITYFLELAEYELKTNCDDHLREFLNSLYMKDADTSKEGVVELMTIHQSKGLEAKIIIIVDLIDKIIPGNRDDMDIEEERRIFYGAQRLQEIGTCQRICSVNF